MSERHAVPMNAELTGQSASATVPLPLRDTSYAFEPQGAPTVRPQDTGVPYLDIRHLHKRYGSFTALQSVSLQIQRGELVCFLGPSGCGKTTLLRAIAGLEAQTSGEIWQDGKNISELPAAQRDYGIVFQSYALFPNLTVADNVAYGLVSQRQPKGLVAQKVHALLETVGLSGSGPKYPAQLSGGQQQRVALARALAMSPGLLLLDEPLSALDATVRVHLRNEIRALQQRLYVTTIMVTHDQEEAMAIADRVVVMNHGVVEQVGTPMEIYQRPATPFVAEFIGKANKLQAIAVGDGGITLGGHKLFCPQAPQLAKGQALDVYLRPEDCSVHNCTAMPPAASVPPATGAPVWTARVEHLEFLGATCIVHADVPRLPEQRIQLQLSPAQWAQLDVQPGRWLQFSVNATQLKIFAQKY
ncbi:iron(III) transport system ATP-binding protein [Comamonas odontotermitis]|uniref:Iron(III) transport system ATP-binding protein n=1 Tax=Comamonas odontotermitis TaxID=379895 RepID=A0ABR6RJZ8_9BURK|nr:putative 2-aminoethylphosphonate ABC transporter ATP-binding protein [Comamonas odontotermitis]MBB6579494.1 iron(III) transport system ATP-binding protein [Comamonas odontotermitis]